MKRYTHFRSAAVFAFVASMLAVSTQCASSPNPKATVDSMGTFGNETAKAKDSIDKAVKSLESLEASQPGEVNVRFASYSKSVKALEEQSKCDSWAGRENEGGRRCVLPKSGRPKRSWTRAAETNSPRPTQRSKRT